MQSRQFVALFVLISVCLSFNTYSETIGRTELELPDSRWTLLTTYVTELKFTGGSSPTSTLPMQNNVYQLPGKDRAPKALLAIIGTHSGKSARINWITMRCPEPKSGHFTDNFGTGASRINYECLIVNNSFGPHNYYKPDSEVMKAVGEKSMKLLDPVIRSGVFMAREMGRICMSNL